MDIVRQASRKIRHDGIASLVTEMAEKLAREKVIRWYVDAKVEYNTDTVTVGMLAQEGALNETTHICPEISRLPVKQSVSPDEDVRGIQSEEISPQLCGILRNVAVLAPSGLVQLPDGRYVADSVGPTHLVSRRAGVALSMHGYKYGIRTLRESLLTPVTADSMTRVDEAVALMPLWSNYFHWTVEGLLKLYWVDRYQERLSTQPAILVPAELTSWMKESLELLGYKETDLVRVDWPRVHVERLLIPSKVESIPMYSQWIRDRMLGAVGKVYQNSRIYITRRNATKRQVSNEEEVVSALRSLGFEPHALDRLSVKEQIKLFAKADAVVGPHGAGFANLIYADDPLVVELFGRKRLNTYHRLAKTLGFDYEPVYCDAEGTDLVVDTSKLLSVLDDRLD